MNKRKSLLLVLPIIMAVMMSGCSKNNQVGPQGEQGVPGEAGVSVVSTYINDNGELILVLSNGQEINAGRINDVQEAFDYYPLDDGTYGIKGGRTSYLSNVVIPETYNGKQITKILPYAFSNFTNLETVVIPDNVITIEEGAFKGCTSLTGVTYAGGLSGSHLNRIGWMAFEDCTSLENIPLPYSLTDISLAFNGCTSLVEFNVPSNVQTIHTDTFWKCSALTNINVDENNQNYSSVDGVLYNKAQTEIVYFPALNPKSFYDAMLATVTSIGNNAFEDSSFVAVSVPSRVTSIGRSAFFERTSLVSIYIPSSVATMAKTVFKGCSNLTIYCGSASKPSGWDSNWNPDNIDVNWGIGEFQFNVSDTEAALVKYYGSDSSVVVPATFQGKPVTTIRKDAFRENTSVKTISLSSNISNIEPDAFYLCRMLESISIGSNNGMYSTDDGIVYNKAKTTLVCVPGGRTGTVSVLSTVTTLGAGCVECPKIEGFNIPSGVTTMDKDVFFACEKLKYVTLPRVLTSIGQTAFQNCYELETIFIPISVVTMGNSVFRHCSSLTIYCEATEKPSGWHNSWNPSDRPVVWGYHQ